MTEVVLKQDMKKLGFKGDVVKVRPGYFRNYLSHTGMAVLADKHARDIAAMQKSKQVMRKEKVAINAKAIAHELKEAVLKFKQKVTAKGHLYGSIDEKTVADALKSQLKVDIDKSNVELAEHIKDVGEHEVTLRLNEDVTVAVKIIVEAE